MTDKYKLFAPKEYWKTDWKRFLESCNGCGNSSTRAITKPVGVSLDKIINISVRPACGIHDWQYMNPKVSGYEPSEKHRAHADRVFYNNLLRIVEGEGERLRSWGITRWLRRKICRVYFLAVKNLGAIAYWEVHNTRDEYKELQS